MLEAAYDDAQGVTAEFNRNVLRVLNRELDADFDPEDFDHVALFDAEHEWIEMRLRARREHTTLVRAIDLTCTSVTARSAHGDQRQVHARAAGGRSRGGGPGAGALADRPRGAVRADALARSAACQRRAQPCRLRRWRSRGLSDRRRWGLGAREATVRALHARGARGDRRRQRREGRSSGLRAGRQFVACDVREEAPGNRRPSAPPRGEGGLRIAVCCAGTGWAQKVAAPRAPTRCCPSRRSSRST